MNSDTASSQNAPSFSMDDFAQALEKYGNVERLPKLEGRRMILALSPKSLHKK